jgi:hypothetical protein
VSKYPEHDKLRAVSKQSQAIGAFLDELQDQNIVLCRWNDKRREHEPLDKTIQQVLAEHFEIDLQELDNEKRAMLDECRAQL